MEALRTLLEAFFGPFDRALLSLPLWVARFSAVLLLLVPALWVALRSERSVVMRGAPDDSRWRDLRLWAILVTLPYVLIYLLL